MNPNFVRVGKSNKTVNSGVRVTVSSCSKNTILFLIFFQQVLNQ